MKINSIIFYLLCLFFSLSLYSQNNFNIDKIKTDKAIVVADRLNFRAGPGLQSKTLLKLMTGDIVKVLEIEKKTEKIEDMEDFWYKVKYNNEIGYLYGFFLSEYSENKIIVNKKNGVILFLKDHQINRKINYNSYFIVSKKNAKEKKEIKEAQLAEIIHQKFVVIKKIVFYYVGSEYLVKEFEIYNIDGKFITHNSGLPFVFYSEKAQKLIIIRAKNIRSYEVDFMNEIELYLEKTKTVKKKSVTMDSRFKDEFNKNEFFFNTGKDRFFWINNSKALLFDLKSLRVKYYNFPGLEQFDVKKNFINLINAEFKKDKLTVQLVPFNFMEGIDYEKIILNIDMTQFN